MTMLFLLRHAQAGVSDHDDPNDIARPLDSYGRFQARWIAERLSREQVDGFYSSPALRCLQTLQPAADRAGRQVLAQHAFTEGSSIAAALEALHAIGENSAVCLHGDLLPEIVKTFANAGMEVMSEPSFAKGVLWCIEFDADHRPWRGGCELAPGEPSPSEATL